MSPSSNPDGRHVTTVAWLGHHVVSIIANLRNRATFQASLAQKKIEWDAKQG
jgi:hypothetical protein